MAIRVFLLFSLLWVIHLNAYDRELFNKQVIEFNSEYNQNLRGFRAFDNSTFELNNLAAAIEKDATLQARLLEMDRVLLRFRELKKTLSLELLKEAKVKSTIPLNSKKEKEEISFEAQILDSSTYLDIETQKEASELLKNKELLRLYRHSLWKLGVHINRLLLEGANIEESLDGNRKSVQLLPLKADHTRISNVRSEMESDIFLNHIIEFMRIIQSTLNPANAQYEITLNWGLGLEQIKKRLLKLIQEEENPDDRYPLSFQSPSLWLEGIYSLSSYFELSFASRAIHPQQKLHYNPLIFDALLVFYKEYFNFRGDYLKLPPQNLAQKDFETSYNILINAINAEISSIDSVLKESTDSLRNEFFVLKSCKNSSCERRVALLLQIENKIKETTKLYMSLSDEFIAEVSKLPASKEHYYTALPFNYKTVARFFIRNR